MRVFKFGGASVKNAENIQNVASILSRFEGEAITIVISAMGKTTNALEDILKSYFAKDGKAFDLLNELKEKHEVEMKLLFPNPNHEVYASVNDTFVEIEWILEDEPHDEYDYVYDQLVSVGELVSTKILAAYLNEVGLKTTWVDARAMIMTDESWRESVVDWTTTPEKVQNTLLPILKDGGFAVTQGFIGSTKDNNTTTLGREGSDYTAAILSNCLHAPEMVIWKDVSGVLTGDPRVFTDVVKMDKIGYDEAIEMTYFGATVVHPRTIAPLVEKKILLKVRSFVNPDAEGTVIGNFKGLTYSPIQMVERNQYFLKVANLDKTFLMENHIRNLFDVFGKYHIFVNLIMPSGACFFVSITHQFGRMEEMIQELRQQFTVAVEENAELYTVRHYDTATIEKLKANRKILFETWRPDTYQIVVQ